MKFLALDPGVSTGWAWFENHHPTSMGVVTLDDFNHWLSEQAPELFVVENYRVYPAGFKQGKGQRAWDHAWDDCIPARLIGAIQYRAEELEVPVTLQPSSIKPVGYANAGLPYNPKKKGVHMFDAVAHGTFYYVNTHKATR